MKAAGCPSTVKSDDLGRFLKELPPFETKKKIYIHHCTEEFSKLLLIRTVGIKWNKL